MVHYYEKKQVSKERTHEIKAVLRNALFVFRTSSGVFSGRHVDAGTRLLVDNCLVKNKWSVLDMGCGYGVVGIVLKKLHQSLDVFMVDINERAVALAEKNAAMNDVVPHIVQGHLYEPVAKMQFDTIIINPPYVAGRKLVYGMLEGAKQHLKKDGVLQVVARHQKGGKAIRQRMLDIFSNVTDHARGSGYHVYLSKNQHAP